MTLYLDSSALVKLALTEAESAALARSMVGHRSRASCAIAYVEVMRVARRIGGAPAVSNARAILAALDLIQVDGALLESAAELDVPAIRALDALHLAAAKALGRRLASIVTYDKRMAAAAGALGMKVSAPA